VLDYHSDEFLQFYRTPYSKDANRIVEFDLLCEKCHGTHDKIKDWYFRRFPDKPWQWQSTPRGRISYDETFLNAQSRSIHRWYISNVWIKVAHYDNFDRLKQSAISGCHLCNLLFASSGSEDGWSPHGKDVFFIKSALPTSADYDSRYLLLDSKNPPMREDYGIHCHHVRPRILSVGTLGKQECIRFATSFSTASLSLFAWCKSRLQECL
jgi:hypothetical protein